MSDDRLTVSTEPLVAYCRMQSGRLLTRSEEMGEAIADLLEELDEDIAAMRARLAEQASGAEGSPISPPTAGQDAPGRESVDLDELPTDLEKKQAIARTNLARRDAFQDLAEAYIELAEELDSTVEDGNEALNRVVRFEHDHDAPAYFEDRRTILEAAATSDTSPTE